MTLERDKLAKIVWEYMHMHHELRPMDAIFILGSNDLRVGERAAELYHQDLGEYVICSGGNGKASDFEKTEAEMFGEVVKDCGVPEEKIILETRANNTGENILFTKKLLKEKDLALTSFILVQKPYMERRTYATFRKQWSEAECIVTSPQITYEEYGNKDEVFIDRFINIMVGDLYRIKKYPALGFQIEQEMPDEVWEAGQKLVEMGYDKYVI